mmetsp:Transcript_5212/g.10006  ORF Transcript_5212/g.10006 Transcript_5212/m.10006 type:complete len:81 (+) Transcript_5212:1486-1728(+)
MPLGRGKGQATYSSVVTERDTKMFSGHSRASAVSSLVLDAEATSKGHIIAESDESTRAKIMTEATLPLYFVHSSRHQRRR